MAEAWRTISVALEADTARYQSQMASASKTTARLGADTSKLSDGATKSSGIWSRAMGSMSAATVAMGTAVGLGTVQIASKFAQLGMEAVNMAGQIGTAQATLEGLYGSAAVATSVMDGLRKVASGSSLEYTGYTKAAEALAYAGVQGDRTIGILENVGKAIVATGGDTSGLESASDALLKMVNLGKVGRRELVSLSNTGVPIISGLAEHFGVTIEEVNELVSAGKVGLEDVLTVMEQGTGRYFQSQIAAADKVEKTWSATWARWKDNAQVAVADVVSGIMPRLMTGAETAGAAIAAVWDQLGGAWSDLQDTGENLVNILGDLWRGIRPVATAIGTLVGGAALGAINTFAGLLSGITSTLSSMEGVIKVAGTALASMWAASKIMAAAQAVQIFVANLQSVAAFRGVSTAQVLLEKIGFGADGAVGGVERLKTSLGGLAATGAVAAGVYAIVSILNQFSAATKKARDDIRDLRSEVAGQGLSGLDTYVEKLERQFDALNEHGDVSTKASSNMEKFARVMRGATEFLPGVTSTVIADGRARAALNDELGRAYTQQAMVNQLLPEIAYNQGIATDAVLMHLASVDDLNVAEASREEIIEAVTGSIQEMAGTMGVTEEAAAGMSGALADSGMEAEDFAKEVDKARQAAAGAIASFTNLASHDFKLDAGAIVSPGQFEKFYTETLAKTETFTAEIQDLIRKGYDPSLVARLMAEGPEKAGPIVTGLVKGYSDELVGLVNDGEAAFREMSNKMAESARLVQTAISAGSDEYTKSLSDAQAIMALSWEGMPVMDIADKLEMDPARVAEVAKNFGIELSGLEALVDDTDLDVEARPRLVTDEFDADYEEVARRLSLFTFSPSVSLTMDVAQFLESDEMAERVLGDLTRQRDALVLADNDPEALWQTQMALDLAAHTRIALVLAEGDPESVDMTQVTLDALTATRDAMVEAGAPQQYIDEVNRQLWDLAVARPADINAAAKGTAKASSDIDGVANKPRTASVHVRAETSGFSTVMNSITNQYRELKFHAKLANTPTLPPALAGAYRRFGGFHSFATGGFSPLAVGGVTRTPMVAWGEHSTGGEAFIPRLGISDTRAKKILDVAAGWHGMQVVPAGQLRGLGGSITVDLGGVHVVAGGGADGRDIAQQVRTTLRQELPTITRAVAEARGQSKAVTGR